MTAPGHLRHHRRARSIAPPGFGALALVGACESGLVKGVIEGLSVPVRERSQATCPSNRIKPTVDTPDIQASSSVTVEP